MLDLTTNGAFTYRIGAEYDETREREKITVLFHDQVYFHLYSLCESPAAKLM